MEVISATTGANWLSSHTEIKQGRGPKAATPAPGQVFVDFLWPTGVGYASPLCPTFLTEHGGVVAQGGRAVCLARDGLVPLLWFFREFPEPKTFSGWLLVHSDLAPFVPNPWRKIAGQYRLQSDPKVLRGKKINGLVLTGVMTDSYCDVPELEERLEKICEDLGISRGGLEQVLAFLPARTDGFGVEHRHEYAIDYVAMLSRFFGSKLKGFTWNGFESRESWQGFAAADLNSRLACADSFLLHRAASRGAFIVGEGVTQTPTTPRQQQILKDEHRWIQLSPYHGMHVEPLIGKCVLENGAGLPEEMKLGFERRFMTAMRSETNRRFPWPKWFAHWTQTLVEEAKKKRPSSRDN